MKVGYSPFLRVGNVRAGKVSIEPMLQVYLQASAKSERAHDRAAMLRGEGGHIVPPAWKKEQANAPTTERRESRGA